jgi:transposase
MTAGSGIHETRGHNKVRNVMQNTRKILLLGIQNKRRGMLTYGVMFLHDNARPHTVARIRAQLEHFNWVLFDQPPYSPDFSPSDYHLFTYLKN